ncbi:winged helix-turn-helix domain-containing protein [Streptomyces shenzhenensis]
MRYSDGGGLTAEQRRRREEVRMRAVDLFEKVSGVTQLLHRMGFSVQIPARPVAERDKGTITAWREATWQEV